MTFRYKKAYLKRFDRFPDHEQALIIEADRQIRHYYTTQTALYGLRIKKLYDNGQDKIFEARVSDKIRILWIESGQVVSFPILGAHNELKNFIKGLK